MLIATLINGQQAPVVGEQDGFPVVEVPCPWGGQLRRVPIGDAWLVSIRDTSDDDA